MDINKVQIQKIENNKKQSRFEDDKRYGKICNDLSHNPPTHLYIPEGQKYIHVCPSCGQETVIRGIGVRF